MFSLTKPRSNKRKTLGDKITTKLPLIFKGNRRYQQLQQQPVLSTLAPYNGAQLMKLSKYPKPAAIAPQVQNQLVTNIPHEPVARIRLSDRPPNPALTVPHNGPALHAHLQNQHQPPQRVTQVHPPIRTVRMNRSIAHPRVKPEAVNSAPEPGAQIRRSANRQHVNTRPPIPAPVTIVQAQHQKAFHKRMLTNLND